MCGKVYYHERRLKKFFAGGRGSDFEYVPGLLGRLDNCTVNFGMVVLEGIGIFGVVPEENNRR